MPVIRYLLAGELGLLLSQRLCIFEKTAARSGLGIAVEWLGTVAASPELVQEAVVVVKLGDLGVRTILRPILRASRLRSHVGRPVARSGKVPKLLVALYTLLQNLLTFCVAWCLVPFLYL